MCLVLRVSAADSACGGFPAAASVCGQGRLFASESACGQGLRTGAHLRCFPSHRCAAGPSPFTKPRAATPSEVPAHPAFPGRGTMLRPLGWRDCPVLISLLHRFASLGLKSRIAARIALVLTSLLHRFASLGLKSGITAVLSFRQVEWPACGRPLPPRCRVRFYFSLPQSRTVPPAEGRYRYDAASDSNFRRSKVERSACVRSLLQS